MKLFLQNIKDVYDRTRLNLSEILKLTELFFSASFFKFKDVIYKQVKGTPMGSPVSVVISEIVMQRIERDILSRISDFCPLWIRYVDDVLAVLPSNMIDSTLDIINSINNDIQFTVEKEESGRINFLDMKIIHQSDGHLNFGIFRKSTNTEKYLDHDSYHPQVHKDSVTRSLFHRAKNICDTSELEEEKKYICKVLENNGYSKSNIIKIRSKIFDNNQLNAANTSNQKHYLSAPYIRGTSERVERCLKKFDVTLAHKPTRTLESELSKLKDKRRTHEQAGVVNKLSCKEGDAIYVGETGRQVSHRMAEHQRDIRLKKPLSKVFEHVRSTGHEFDFEGLKILDKSSNVGVRKQLESIHSSLQGQTINRRLNINSTYDGIINLIKKLKTYVSLIQKCYRSIDTVFLKAHL